MRNAATQEALRSAMRYRHGAVIVKGGKVLGQGHNHVRTGFSGPLSAHEAIVLPMRRGLDPCAHGAGADMCAPTSSGRAQAYFSMHAEMHAVTSALRGARPNLKPSSVRLDPLDEAAAALDSLDLDLPVCSRGSDVPASEAPCAPRRAADVKAKCTRALVEGAKREQQRIAFDPDTECCFKPRDQRRVEEKPASHAPRRRLGGARWACRRG